jgi:hypothetical protein
MILGGPPALRVLQIIGKLLDTVMPAVDEQKQEREKGERKKTENAHSCYSNRNII